MELPTHSQCFAVGAALALLCATPTIHAQEAEPPPTGQNAQSPAEPVAPSAAKRPSAKPPARDVVRDVGQGDMETEMRRYFRGERLGGVGFSSVGLSSLIAGGLMLRSDSDFYRGMSYPLLGLGGAQLLVGGIVLFTPGPRMRRFARQIRDDRERYHNEEEKRIRGVKLTFKLLVITEIAAVATGAGLVIYGATQDRDTLAGIGAGLIAEGALLLLQDSLASRRASRYLRALRDLRLAVAPAQNRYWLSYGRTF